MKAPFLTLMMIGVSTLAVACAPHDTRAPGKYESSATAVSRDGTKTTVNEETNVYYDRDGNKRSTVKTETSKDPKGLFNKQTTEKVRTY